MLSTLLEIGRTFRQSPEGLKHHRYVKRAPQRDLNRKNKKALGNTTEFFRVPVQAEGSFDFALREKFEDENLRALLFFLNYKTSDADTYKKYIVGDIWKVLLQQGKQTIEDGNFRFGDDSKTGLYRVNSFERGVSDAESLNNPRINAFRASFKKQMEEIETFLREHPNVYLHFNISGKHWHHQDDMMSAVNAKLLDSFIRQVQDEEKGVDGYVLQKTLYKTLTSAGEGPSGKVPGFEAKGEYKNRLFSSTDQVMDLLYVIDFSTKPLIRKGDVKIIVLPRGEDLSAEQIERFFSRQSLETASVENAAERIRSVVSSEERGMAWDEMFAAVLDGIEPNFKQFDFIFSKAGSGPSSPDVDMLEISGIERSLLETLSIRACRIREQVEIERPKSDKIFPLSITQSFLNILGDATTAKKKYHSHLFKVLPQIYTGTYFNDPVLLPALIEKTEFNIRNDKGGFGLLRFDFYFLTKLLNQEEDGMDDIVQSQSYQVGLILGRLARQFAGPKSPIKSFEKNYVGLLSRRITSLDEVRRLGNDINQKLVMHELTRFTFRDSHAFAETVKNFSGIYDKDKCAFGFFESYFAPLPKKIETDDETDQNAEVAA